MTGATGSEPGADASTTPKPKTYELTDIVGHAYVYLADERINRALGEPDHVRQFRLFVCAERKWDAIAALRAVGKLRASDDKVRAVFHPYARALREAGYLSECRVIVTSATPVLADPVAALTPGPSPREFAVEALPAPVSALVGAAQ